MGQSEEESTFFNPITYMLEFIAAYGWFMVGGAALSLYVAHRLRPALDAWRQAREDAEYHKDPDKAAARMEAVRRARELQQQKLLAASQRALDEQKEREERKRAEALERLKYGSAAAGHKLGTDDGYLPLSGGASTSSYKPPKKKSACSGGGCGR